MNLSNVQPRIHFRSQRRGKGLADISDLVTSFSIEKSLNKVSGTCQINLASTVSPSLLARTAFSHDSTYHRLNFNDIITVDYGIPIMTALVDLIGKYSTYGESLNQGIAISARDFGALPEDDNIGFLFAGMGVNDEIRKAESYLGADHPLLKTQAVQRAPGGTFLNKTVQESVEFILDNLVVSKTPIIFDDAEKTILEILAREIKSWPGDAVGSDFSLIAYEGSVLNFLNTIIDLGHFYELMIDTYPRITGGEFGFTELGDSQFGFPVLRVRPKPFSDNSDPLSAYNDWNELKTWITGEDYHTIYDDEVIEFDSSVSKNNVYSAFFVESEKELIFDKEFRNSGIYFPVFEIDLLNRFGYRPLAGRSAMIREADNYATLFRKRDLLASWNRYNEFYESGHCKIIGNPRIKIGDKVYFDGERSKGGKRGLLAYVVSVAQNYDVERKDLPKLVTSISFSRGHNPDEYRDFLRQTEGNILQINAGKEPYAVNFNPSSEGSLA